MQPKSGQPCSSVLPPTPPACPTRAFLLLSATAANLTGDTASPPARACQLCLLCSTTMSICCAFHVRLMTIKNCVWQYNENGICFSVIDSTACRSKTWMQKPFPVRASDFIPGVGFLDVWGRGGLPISRCASGLRTAGSGSFLRFRFPGVGHLKRYLQSYRDHLESGWTYFNVHALTAKQGAGSENCQQFRLVVYFTACLIPCP